MDKNNSSPQYQNFHPVYQSSNVEACESRQQMNNTQQMVKRMQEIRVAVNLATM